jgi:hypothetical protein
LRLPTVAVRRNHHVPGHRGSNRGAVLAAQEIEAEVDTRSGACAGHHLTFIDIEHIGIHLDCREPTSDFGSPPPVCGRPLAIKQPG